MTHTFNSVRDAITYMHAHTLHTLRCVVVLPFESQCYEITHDTTLRLRRIYSL